MNITTQVAVAVGLLFVVGIVRANGFGIDNTSGEFSGGADTLDAWAGSIDQYNPLAMMNSASNNSDLQDQNVAAFLAVIQFSEGTSRAPDPYAVCYGYRHTIRDFSDHPAIAEGWGGESIDKLGPMYKGKVSTAAGAYQIIKPTWVGAKKALGLTDFSGDSQDRACVWLIKQAGALGDVKEGLFSTAVGKCSGTWASLPGSTAKQPTQRFAALRNTYTSAGGYIA